MSIQQINRFFEGVPDQLSEKRYWVLGLLVLITVFFAFGIKNVVIDESLTAYFQEDDPVKQAYDQFRSIFGGDEYVYVVYRAKDGDIFSPQSTAALKKLHHDLSDYRLKLAPGTSSALDHIEEVKSLINVKYMEAKNHVLTSKNFIGDRLPRTFDQSEVYRRKALSHPDYPLVYLSLNSQFGGIMIRTGFNARKAGLSDFSGNETMDRQSAFDDDTDLFSEEDETVITLSDTESADEIVQTDIREYPAFMDAVRRILENDQYARHLEFYPVGNPVLMDFFTTAVIKDMGRLMTLVLLLIVIMLWLLFRSFAAVVWPVVIVVLTIAWVLGLVGWVNIPMSAMIQVILFLALSIGIADAVHILSGYLFFRNQKLDHQQALRAVFKKSGLACLLTSLTTSVGLLSLTLVPLKPIAFFGLFAAVAVQFAFFFTILLLPLMLDLWSPVSRRSHVRKEHIVLKIIKQFEHTGLTHPKATIAVFIVLGFVFLAGLYQLKVDSDFVEIIKKGLPLRDAYTLVDTHMAGTGNMEVMLEFKKENALKDPHVLSAMADLQAFMENDPENPFHQRITKTLSLVNVVKESFKALHDDDSDYFRIPEDPRMLGQVLFMFENANPKDRQRLVTDDYTSARIGIHSINVGSIEAVQILETVQAFIDNRFSHLKTTYPDLDVTLTGNMALLAIMLDYIAWAQIKSFGLALLVISVILFLVLGSSKAGLVALAPNLFPILATFGLMGYFNIPLDADTLLVAPIIIGLAVDDTIHFMTHFRIEIGKSHNIARSAVKAIREAGQAITFTSIILSAGFLVFILSFHNGISRFGIFAAIAVMTALISDIFLLPALCKCMNVNFNRQLKGDFAS